VGAKPITGIVKARLNTATGDFAVGIFAALLHQPDAFAQALEGAACQ
jgi:hypothetical protein